MNERSRYFMHLYFDEKIAPWNIWNISSILSESHNSKLCLAPWFRTAVRSLQQLSGSHSWRWPQQVVSTLKIRVRDIHQVVVARCFLCDLFASSWFHQSDYAESHKMMIISRMMITVIIMCLILIFNVTCRASTFQVLSSFLTVHCKSWRGQEQLELYRNQNRFSDCAVSETHGHQNCFPCCFFF